MILPFFYPLGLQVVLAGVWPPGSMSGLDRHLDKINNGRVILQSIHAVDPERHESSSVRTWGQFVTGRFQDAIEKAIERYLATPQKRDRGPTL